MPKKSDPHGMVPDRSSVALLILDMISDFQFEDGAQIFRAALPVAKRIAALAARVRKRGIPVIYVNDNLGKWRSDFPALVARCSQDEVRGAPIARMLAPTEDDYCVLKARHSGFYATPLDTILQYLGARKLIVTGTASDQCILFTANDAYLRGYALHIPNDCVVSRTKKDRALAIQYFKSVLGARTDSSVRQLGRGYTRR